MDPPPCVQAPAQGQQRTVGKECHKNLIWLFSFAGRTASGVRGGIGGAVPPPTPPCLPDYAVHRVATPAAQPQQQEQRHWVGLGGCAGTWHSGASHTGCAGPAKAGKGTAKPFSRPQGECLHRVPASRTALVSPPPGSSAHRLICPGYAGTSGPILGRVQIPGVCGVGGEGYVFKVD